MRSTRNLQKDRIREAVKRAGTRSAIHIDRPTNVETAVNVKEETHASRASSHQTSTVRQTAGDDGGKERSRD
jgi:hypothetical protein